MAAHDGGLPTVRVTHLGGPTVLLEVDGWRILTDPTFDPPGRRYGFGWGTASTKTTGPALDPETLGEVDVVLLSHDHHADNLDDLGRAFLPRAGTVLTTTAAARRLRAGHVRGLRVGESMTLRAEARPPLTVRATPCRHGPPLSRPIAGPVIGFTLSRGEDGPVSVWMTGDTVLHGRLLALARTLEVDVLLLHLGRVRFPITGPLGYSMDSADAIELVGLLRPRVVIPVHYEGWSHFSEPEQDLRAAVAQADPQVRERFTWLTPGAPKDV